MGHKGSLLEGMEFPHSGAFGPDASCTKIGADHIGFHEYRPKPNTLLHSLNTIDQ